MLIAPDSPRADRSWVPVGHPVLAYLPPVERTVRWTVEPLDEAPRMEFRHATLRRYRHPSWRIALEVYVSNGLGASEPWLPAGYVMPGWIEGEVLEFSPLVVWVWDGGLAQRWTLVTPDGQEIGWITAQFLASHPDGAEDACRRNDWPSIAVAVKAREAHLRAQWDRKQAEVMAQFRSRSPEDILRILDGEDDH